MLEQLAAMLKPEQLVKALEHFIPPSGKAIITLLPSLMQSRYDIGKHAMPEMSIKKKEETKQVMVIYTFEKPEDMEAFYASETKALVMVSQLGEIAKRATANTTGDKKQA